MPILDFIISVFCLIDDEYKNLSRSPRRGGFAPALSDSEVMTMEIVGEFLGYETDKGLWTYFKEHWQSLFPKLGDRTSFVRQAANLHIIKRMMQEAIAKSCGAFSDQLHHIDGFPMHVCQFSRAYFSRIFKGEAAYGYCATKQEIYYGFHGHLAINSIGVISGATFTPANIDERDVCPEILERLQGLVLGDKGYIRPKLKESLAEHGVYLQTPLRDNMQEERPEGFLKWMKGKRRLIETVIGQLAERFHIERIRARDIWHHCSRFWRKLLAHTVCLKINLAIDNDPLQFDNLIC
jgi:DDE family transposase